MKSNYKLSNHSRVSSISTNTISTLHAKFYLKFFLCPTLKVCGESQGPNSEGFIFHVVDHGRVHLKAALFCHLHSSGINYSSIWRLFETTRAKWMSRKVCRNI